jgi:hypothetical protein
MAAAPGAASVNLSHTTTFVQARLKKACAQQRLAERVGSSSQQNVESEVQNEAHRSAVDVSFQLTFYTKMVDLFYNPG